MRQDGGAAGNIPERLVLFDGVCNLCNRSVRFIIRHDPHGRFRFAPLQHPRLRTLLPAGSLPTGTPESVLYMRQGRLYTHSSAALWILRDLGGGWRLLWAGIIVPRPLRDAVYRWVARNRYRWFGRREACMVPTPDLRERFLAEAP